jgi:hypothetical protein
MWRLRDGMEIPVRPTSHETLGSVSLCENHDECSFAPFWERGKWT